VNWGNQAWVEIPLRLKRLGLPPLGLAMRLHSQIDDLSRLTWLECIGTGYYPSNALSRLEVRPIRDSSDAFDDLTFPTIFRCRDVNEHGSIICGGPYRPYSADGEAVLSFSCPPQPPISAFV
jgi:hypothetical protein